MTDFDYDVLTRKRLARNNIHKKNGSKSKKCTLPSDYLNSKQKEERNGPMTTYSMNKPMTYAELKAMPVDLQREYLLGLQNKYGVGNLPLARMLGVSDVTVRNLKVARSIPNLGHGGHMTKEQLLAWSAFLRSGAAAEPSTTPETVSPAEPEPVELVTPEPTQQTEASVVELHITLEHVDSWSALLAKLSKCPDFNGPARVSLTITQEI